MYRTLDSMDNFLRQTAADASGTDSVVLPPSVRGYRTERMLGAGASASVWLIRQQSTGQAHALKVFPHSGEHDIARSEMVRELAILSRLSHPHLLTVQSVLATDQGPALLMPLAQGGSLGGLVGARRRLSVGESVTVLTPIAQAVAYLHKESVLHGDISPGNVLLTVEGKPLLSDLGIGRLVGESLRPAEGTPGFIDPAERRATGLNLTADVYALAALGWYCLTGQVAGPARERPPLTLLVPGVPPDLLSILESGLHMDPGQRPSAAEFADEVLRSSTPEPLDLVPAVHPTVRPELLTRRAVRSREPKRQPSKKLPFRRIPRRKGKPVGNKSNLNWRTGVLGLVAVGLVVGGALVAVPPLAEAIGQPSPGKSYELSQDNVPEAVADAAPPLSPEMRERLSNDDELVVLPALAAVRARALSTADQAMLDHVNVPGSETMATDRQIVKDLAAQGRVFDGLNVQLQDIEPLEALEGETEAARVSATVVTSAYNVLEGGSVIEESDEATTQRLLFVLERHDDHWKISAVHEAGNA